MGNLLSYSFHVVSRPPRGWGRNRPSLPATQQRDEYHCVKSLLWNFNNTLLITLEHKELGGGHRAAELWIGLISEGEGSDPYISYTGVTLPDLRQISHLTQLFAITKCGVHYKRFFFFFPSLPRHNFPLFVRKWQPRERFKCYCGEKGIFLLNTASKSE